MIIDNTTEMAIAELLFYSECQMQAMIAENKQREIEEKSMAYTEEQFMNLAEYTRKIYQALSQQYENKDS